MLIFGAFSNEETYDLIGLSGNSNIELIFITIPVLFIPLFLAKVLIDKEIHSAKPTKESLTFIDFLISTLILIAYPLFDHTYTTFQRNLDIHKTSLLESSYYKNLSADEKDYFKLELLEKNNGCNKNISCKDGFNYHIKLKDVDQIITDIKKQRDSNIQPQTIPTTEKSLNKKFWELIQK